MEKATIQELSTSVLTELQRLGYASGTIAFYRKTYQKFIVMQRRTKFNGIP
jgi:hypothetical protein